MLPVLFKTSLKFTFKLVKTYSSVNIWLGLTPNIVCLTALPPLLLFIFCNV